MVDSVGSVQRAAPPPARSAPPAAPAPEPQTAAKLSTFQASTETQSRLTILTEDGDRVTLSSHSTTEVGYADYRYLGYQAGSQTDVHGQALTVTASREFSISVDGDLSRDELHDIRKLVHDLDKVVRDALRGRDEKAADRAARIGDLGSLAGFELVVNHEERQTATVQTEARQTDPPAAPPPDAAPAAPAPRHDDGLASLVERVTRALRDATRGLEKVQRLLPRLVTDLMDGLDRDQSLEPYRPRLGRLRQSLHERLDGRERDADAAPQASAPREASTTD
jgi:hypothetical protein